MSKFQLIILLFFFSSGLFSQNRQDSLWNSFIKKDLEKLNQQDFENIPHVKAYRIWNSYQILDLIQVDDSTYTGQLINYVTKKLRNGKKEIIVSEQLKVPDYTVKNLIDKLTAEKLDSLPDSSEIEGYVSGLDGTFYVFQISLNKSKRTIEFWEPENDYYQNPALPEVKSIRNILQAIKKDIDLRRIFKNFIDNLEKGTYLYGGLCIVKL